MPHKKTSGIYKITCSANNKIYIGSAINLVVREQQHFSTLKNNTHMNKHLQNAYNKYGIETFRFSVFEYVNPPQLISREQHWMDKLKPKFNICQVAGSLLGCKMSEETKRKIGEANKGKSPTKEARLKMSNVHKGIPFSKERRKKMSEAHMGKPSSITKGEKISKALKGRKPYWRVGKKHTEETLMKMRGKIPPNRLEKDIDAHDMNGVLLHCFNNTREAREILGVKRGTKIHECCRKNNLGGNYSYGGYIWKYSEALDNI